MADYFEQEKAAGRKAARRLRQEIRGQAMNMVSVGKTPNSDEDSVGSTTVSAVTEHGELNALRISTPRHAMILNYGFEGVKENGVRMNLKPAPFIIDPVNDTHIVSNLADELAAIRGDKVSALVKNLPKKV